MDKLLRILPGEYQPTQLYLPSLNPLHITDEGSQLFQNWWKSGGGGVGIWRFLLEQGGKAKCGVCLVFWRFLMVQHREKYWCVYLSFVNKYVLQNNSMNKNEMIGIVIVLIVLIVIIAVSIIQANKKHSPWYFYLSDNVNKQVLKIIS